MADWVVTNTTARMAITKMTSDAVVIRASRRATALTIRWSGSALPR